ncbi:MAG: dioxygenase [Kangiellaceae bacterium]|nr:dioxygenase [Kangiellaceae bacterium]MCW8998858.1 dioxygenase [Kangiellaceae bacterium]
MSTNQSSIIYLSHGGGPLPLLGDPAHKPLIETLQLCAQPIPKPDTIVIFSAHWETNSVEITSATEPSLIYDYFGFAEESYSIRYPAKSNPRLAGEMANTISASGISVSLNETRGFDHGMFVPLKIMYPQADIPCVQISLSRNLDPELHIKLGQSLRAFKERNILFVGSGSSFHNLQHFFNPSEQEKHMNDEFHRWLNRTLSDSKLSEAARQNSLVNWKTAPNARFCHPREEHLIPLHICYGLAGGKAEQVYSCELFKMQLSCFRWN